MRRGRKTGVWGVAVMVLALVALVLPSGGTVVGRNGIPPYDAGAAPGPGALPYVPDWSVLGEGNGERFGYMVASAGDVNGDGYADVIVGAYGYPNGLYRGRAYAFYGSPSGLSTTPDWMATGEADDQRFGYSVAGAGDVNGDGYQDVVVGAFQGAANKGKIYVYAGSPTGLESVTSWTAEGANEGDAFGFSVAGAGDVNGDGYQDIVVGSPTAGSMAGQGYLYLGSATGIGAPAWTASGESVADFFGDAVAGAGDVNGDGYADVLVGAPGYAGTGQGAAYVYVGSATGLSATPAWIEIGETSGDAFGDAVSGAGDVNGDGYADVIIGAHFYDEAFAGGKAYVFAGSGAGLGASPLWAETGDNVGEQFGTSVSSAGDVDGDGYADVVVGSPLYASGHGLVYFYAGGSAGPSALPDWELAGENENDRFGYAVAGAGDVNGDGFADLVVGADGYANGNLKGKAYAFLGRGDPPSYDVTWEQTGQNPNDLYGNWVAHAGDVNADGYADVIVGAPAHPSANWQGKAYAYYGSPQGLSPSPGWTVVGEEADDWFGYRVAGAGDVNGDGYADVLVEAWAYPAYARRGKVYLYHGGAAGLSTSPAWTAEGENDVDAFGVALAGAGDLNGDGYGDVVVGAIGYPGGSSQGKVYAYYGSAAGLGASADWSLEGENNVDCFGSSVAGAGDVNGDGYGDLVIGAEAHPAGDWRGKVYVFHGGASGLGATANWSEIGENDLDYFGASVSTAGDVNGDGYADVVVGANRYPGLVGRGKVYVYYGSPSGLGGGADWEQGGEHDHDHFGTRVATAGDVDGDGYADVIATSEHYVSGAQRGKAHVFPGAATGLGYGPTWIAAGENDLDSFGYSAAPAGDVNGDGYPEVIVGAFGYPAAGNRGKVYVYDGNETQGREVLARQVRGDGSGALVQPWGLAHKGDRFVVSMWATDPMGRRRVKLEVEACPPGVASGDSACIRDLSSTWRDVTASASGIAFVETVTGLDVETLYRWRARVLWAPFTVDQPGITAPPNPAHGPWRRFTGQAVEADLRTVRGWEVYLPLVLRE